MISEWAEPTTMSMPSPFTCSALTVIDPAPPLGELVCSLTMRLMPPGNEMERFGLETAICWPAAISPTSSELPVTEAVEPLQEAPEFDFVIAPFPFEHIKPCQVIDIGNFSVLQRPKEILGLLFLWQTIWLG